MVSLNYLTFISVRDTEDSLDCTLRNDALLRIKYSLENMLKKEKKTMNPETEEMESILQTLPYRIPNIAAQNLIRYSNPSTMNLQDILMSRNYNFHSIQPRRSIRRNIAGGDQLRLRMQPVSRRRKVYTPEDIYKNVEAILNVRQYGDNLLLINKSYNLINIVLARYHDRYPVTISRFMKVIELSYMFEDIFSLDNTPNLRLVFSHEDYLPLKKTDATLQYYNIDSEDVIALDPSDNETD